MQSERGCLSRSRVRKPVAQGFTPTSAGAFALSLWWSWTRVKKKPACPRFPAAAAETAALRNCLDTALVGFYRSLAGSAVFGGVG